MATLPSDIQKLIAKYGYEKVLQQLESKRPLEVEPEEPNAEVEMIPVSSSNVSEIGFDAMDGAIIVEFLDGSRYSYPGQSKNSFENFLGSESKGRYVWSRLRGTGERRIG